MTAANQAQKKKKDDEEQEVNINMLMEDLKKDIHFAYNNRDYTLGSQTDMYSKSTIQLLHEIELKVAGYMNEIEYIKNAEKMTSDPNEKFVR